MTDFSRYDRQIKLSEIGAEGQEKLHAAKILIIGVGGLGCPASMYLAAAGVGNIGLVDFDKVDDSNLHRQVLFIEDDLGKNKAEAAKDRLNRRNSHINVVAFNVPFGIDNAIELISKYDLILDGTDNFQTKYLINDACLKANKPFVGASIYKYQGQLSVFNYQNGPSYRCLYPNHHYKDSSNCEETGVLGVLPGILGTMQATEALKIILGVGTPLSGKVKIVDTLTMQDQLIQFQRKEDEINKIKNQPLELEQAICSLSEASHLYLDVREPFEQPRPCNDNLIEIPLSQLKERNDEIPKDQAVHVFCQSGIRSKKAIELLEKEFGFSNLVDAGGIEELI